MRSTKKRVEFNDADFRWGILTRKVARALLLKRSEIAQREEPYGARFDQLI